MGAMRIDPRAWLVSAVVIALLWLAVEGEVGLAGIVVDNVFGWGLIGFSVWLVLVKGPARRWLGGQDNGRP